MIPLEGPRPDRMPGIHPHALKAQSCRSQ
jgi:hypothetical protein